jgi:hypothetical protein
VLCVGLDVHRRRTQVSVMDEGGHELFNRNIPNDPERLSDVLCGAGPGAPVVSEGAYGGLGWPSYCRTWVWKSTWATPGRARPSPTPG